MVFNTTINNISVISGWSVLLMEEAAVLRENHLNIRLKLKINTHRLNFAHFHVKLYYN